eukprot:113861-Prorocentrum_lima.AAC.1
MDAPIAFDLQRRVARLASDCVQEVIRVRRLLDLLGLVGGAPAQEVQGGAHSQRRGMTPRLLGLLDRGRLGCRRVRLRVRIRIHVVA